MNSTKPCLLKAEIAFKEGFALLISTNGLKALRKALEINSSLLIQGVVTEPSILECIADWEVEGACAIGYCGWIGEKLKTIKEVEKYFTIKCHQADIILDGQAYARDFLLWYDNTPQEEVRFRLIFWTVEILGTRNDY